MFDITPQLQMLEYTLYRILTDAMFAVCNVFLGGARITLVLRNLLGDVGANVLGELFHEMGPLWTVALFMVLIGFAVVMFWRFLFTSFQVTTPERFIFVTLLAGYLMASGSVAVQWYTFYRRALGHLTYDIAYRTTQANGAPIPGGGTPVEPRCDLSHDDPDTTLCTGYEFALSYLGYQFDAEGENGIFAFRAPHGFNMQYFAIDGQVIDPSEFAGKPDWQRAALLASAQQAPLVGAGGIPISIMALVEEVVRLLLTMATLAIFSGLAVAVIFGAFTPLSGILSNVINQIIRLLITTATVELIMGLFAGFLWLAQGNGILFLGAGLLALAVDGVLLFQSGSIVIRSLEQSMHGDIRLGAPDMLRGGGFQQLGGALGAAGSAAGAVVDAVAGGRKEQHEMRPGEMLAGLMLAQTAVRALSPLVASSPASGPGPSNGSNGNSGQAHSPSGGQPAGHAQASAPTPAQSSSTAAHMPNGPSAGNARNTSTTPAAPAPSSGGQPDDPEAAGTTVTRPMAAGPTNADSTSSGEPSGVAAAAPATPAMPAAHEEPGPIITGSSTPAPTAEDEPSRETADS